jgi:hypothetical protein
MKRIAMLLCLVMALGWISDTGLVSLKYDNGSQIKGLPVPTGYTVTLTYNNVTTSLTCSNQNLQYKIFGNAGILVDGKWVTCTRLGNGWLFKFKESKANVSGLSNR